MTGPESSTDSAPPPGWPAEVRTAHVQSSADGTSQPTLIYSVPPSNNPTHEKPDGDEKRHPSVPPPSEEKRPLLVALHTWSATYKQAQGQTAFARWCIDQRWHFIHPHFRGPNRSADACGSDLAVQDVLDAVSYMQDDDRFAGTGVDETRIYLVGVSGGGHMALLLAGRAPHIWAGVSAWASISDLRQWWKERVDGIEGARRYARHIESAVGGRPDEDDEEEEDGGGAAAVSHECTCRSPLTHLPGAADVGVNLDINAGVADGREGGGSVPFTHSLLAYNAVVPPSERLDEDFIDEFYATRAPPGGGLLGTEAAKCSLEDPLYQGKDVLFRRMHGNSRVTIFEGGHEIIHVAALNWLAAQRLGKQAVWSPRPVHLMAVDAEEGQSGK